jgi:predicted MFS family arabinose efflux permease
VSRLVPRLPQGLPGAFWWIFGGQAVAALATFVFPFLALFLGSRGFAPTRIGLMAALFGAGSLPAGPVAGSLADRFGRRPTLLAALVSAAALTALLAVLASPVAVALDVLLLGVAVHAYFSPMNAAVADLLPPERYAEAYGLLYWVRNLGIAFSFAVGGSLAAHGYAPLFMADAATTLTFALIVFGALKETKPAHSPSSPTEARGFGKVLSDRHFLALLALQVFLLLAMFQFMVALPMAMAALRLAPSDYGRAMAVNGAMIALLQPLAGRVTRGRDDGRVLALAALLIGVGTGCYALCATPLEFALATAVWSVGEILTLPTLSALVARLAPPDLRGRYQGLFGFSFGLGLTLAPAVGGAVLGRFGAKALFAGTASLGVLVALGHLAAGRARANR